MYPAIAPAEVLAIDVAHDATLTLSLSTAWGAAAARARLSTAERHALPHCAALWGHGRGCPGRLDVLRGALDRCLRALGAQPAVIIVRPGDQPAFWLQVTDTTGASREIELSVLDTVALLLGDQVRVAVEATPEHAG